MSVTKYNTESIDLASARWDYENTRCSFKQLSKKYGGYPMFYSRVAKEHGWERYSKASSVDIAVAEFKERESVISRPQSILETVGVRKVQEIIKELGHNYSTTDEPMVIAYAESYQRYLKIAQEVNEEGEVLISPKTGGQYINPKFNVMQSLKANLKDFGNQLGLSIASRKKLGLNFGESEDTNSLFALVDELSGAGDIDV